jgi:long-subunit acyl-CoA synthetase (AMP-forming)
LHPEAIEGRLNVNDDIAQSVVFAQGGRLTALVVPRTDTPETRERIRDSVADVNRNLDSELRIARIVFSHPLTAEDGSLTANLKLNRKVIEARFESAQAVDAA